MMLPFRTVPALAAAAVFTFALSTDASAQQFGGAAEIVGPEVFIAQSASEREPGAVFVYRSEAGEWIEVGRLEAPMPATRDEFGRALARAGETLVVGAPGAVDGAGAVYLFERGEDGWERVGELTDAGLEGIGRVVAARVERMLVLGLDAAAEEPVVATYARAADGSWEPTGLLRAEGEPGFGQPGFGAGPTLAVGGDIAAVGAPGADERAGAVYVFRHAGGDGWVRAARLSPEGAGSGGAALAMVDGELLVGAPGSGGGTGVVHRYAEGPDGAWVPLGTLAPEGLEGAAGFGAALDAHGDAALVGAPLAADRAGRAWILHREGDGWRVGEALGPAGAEGVQAGVAVALGEEVAVLGAPGDDFGAGSAWILAGADGSWGDGLRVVSEQTGLPAIAGGQVDCVEGEAEGFDCERVDLLSFVPREELGAGRGARLNDVWGWTDPETGREVAIVGRMDGTAFVDVSDPYHPRYLGNLPKTEGSRSNTWRDMKVYEDHVFVVADGAGEHGMQVFDLTRLRDVTEPVEFEETVLYEGVASAHNVIINEETGFAYLVGASGGGETCGGGLHMVDIREPLNPTFAGCFAHPNTGRRGTGGSHDAQCVVYEGPDADYAGREICVNSNETALSIADVTDKENPVAIAQAAYPNVGYVHQGWFAEDQRYFYSNDELDEVGGLVENTRTLVWDLSDLDDPTLVREYYSPTKVTDHNMYVKGDRLYMSNNRSGLRVVDIGDPENPVEVGFFDTTPWSEDEAGFDGTWSVYPYFESGTILLSSRREGLFLVKARDERLVP